MRRFTAFVTVSVAALLASNASAAFAAPPEQFEGNATTCEDAIEAGADFTGTDLDNTVIMGTVSEDGTELDVELINDDWTITAVIVKGGPRYMVYTEPPWEDLVAPLNDGGNVPEISHWFACGEMVEPTQPPTTPPTDEPTVPPTDEPTVPPTDEPTQPPTDEPTPTSEPSATPTPSPGDLPKTGMSPALMLLVGMTLIGGAALALRSRFTQ